MMGDNITESPGTAPAQSRQCFSWMISTLTKPNVTLEAINQQHTRRFYGGLALLGFIIVAGILGNVHVLVLYYRKFKVSNYRLFIIWLSCLGIINCCISAPLIIFYLVHPITYPSEGFCKVTRFTLYFFAVASTSAMVVIAIERYRKIMTPHSTQISLKMAKLMCLLSLVVAGFLSWPAPILFGLTRVPTGVIGIEGVRCLMDDSYTNTIYMPIYHFSTLLYFVIVTIWLIVVYVCIAKKVLKSGKFKDRVSSVALTSNSSMRGSNGSCISKTVTKTFTFLAVTFAYIACATPHHVLALLFFLTRDLDCRLSLSEAQIYYTFVWSYFLNSAINPCIYAYRDRQFRQELKSLYGECCRPPHRSTR
ncbi:G-protein coupled receptor 83-like [Crassostrea virginica]